MGQVARASLVYLDANILIRITEGVADDQNTIHAALQPYVASQAAFVTSELGFIEVLVHPIRQQNHARIERYHRLMTAFVAPLPVSREVLFTAAQLRADFPALRAPDAVHTATAILAKASVFITGDRGIKTIKGALLVEHI
jgi:predicted nucleic acid-binding protein